MYYRLAIISVFLPPLRERKEDVPALVDFFVGHYNRKFRRNVQGLNEETRRLLMSYNWPGNVRELKNALERAMLLEEGTLLRPDDLPFAVASGRSGTAGSAPTAMEVSSPAAQEPQASSLPSLSERSRL